MQRHWFKFRFQLPKNLVLELKRKHFSCSENISWEAIGIWTKSHLSGQRLMDWLRRTITFQKMLRLKYHINNLDEIYLILLFTLLYPQRQVYVYTETSYQSPEMLIWQTSHTWKEVLCKMPLKHYLGQVKLLCCSPFNVFKKCTFSNRLENIHQGYWFFENFNWTYAVSTGKSSPVAVSTRHTA